MLGKEADREIMVMVVVVVVVVGALLGTRLASTDSETGWPSALGRAQREANGRKWVLSPGRGLITVLRDFVRSALEPHKVHSDFSFGNSMDVPWGKDNEPQLSSSNFLTWPCLGGQVAASVSTRDETSSNGKLRVTELFRDLRKSSPVGVFWTSILELGTFVARSSTARK
mmetsp:Transcript_29711/g.63153  ORF Transcript_29711/g.63153 Transcript_29711/m.63153 type:complete len:170 (+) Transcript_29711:432-941(+)